MKILMVLAFWFGYLRGLSFRFLTSYYLLCFILLATSANLVYHVITGNQYIPYWSINAVSVIFLLAIGKPKRKPNP